MATLLKCDAVFLHVPKTGGMYVRRLLQAMDMIRFDFSRDHSDMERTLHTSKYYPGNFYKRSFQLGKNLDTYASSCFKFCVIRNPIDWDISYWRFMSDLKWKSLAPTRTTTRFGFRYDQWHPLVVLEQYADADFNVFMRKVLDNHPGYLSQLFSSYADPSAISFVAKQETLIEDMATIFHKLNIAHDSSIFLKPGRVNESFTAVPNCSSLTRDRIIRNEEEIFIRYSYPL